jgi:hypothetical protein
VTHNRVEDWLRHEGGSSVIEVQNALAARRLSPD